MGLGVYGLYKEQQGWNKVQSGKEKEMTSNKEWAKVNKQKETKRLRKIKKGTKEYL